MATDDESRPVPVRSPGAAAAAASSSRAVDAFLHEVRTVSAAADGTAPRLVFALDATMSRQPTWDLAAEVQAGMFDAAAAIGSLAVQLVYFRGAGECRASRWVGNARDLGSMMSTVACRSGRTQIGRVLSHVRSEVGRGPVRALIYVGDAVEEDADELCAAAGELGLLGVKAFLFHEGGDPATAAIFAEVARVAGGAAFPFDLRAPATLAALLRAVAAYASGGRPALDRLARREPEARRLLGAIPS